MWTRSELKTQAKNHLRNRYWTAFVVALVTSLLGSGSNIFSTRFDLGDIGLSTDNIKNFPKGDIQVFINTVEKLINSGVIFLALFIGAFLALIAVCFKIFISSVVQAGGNRWFSRNRESLAAPTVGLTFSLFKAGSYLKTVGGMLWMNLFLFLWGLFASVPAILGFIYIGIKVSSVNFVNYQKYLPADWIRLFLRLLIEYLPYLFLFSFISVLFAIPLYIKSYSYRMTPWILADNPGIGFRRALQLSRRMTKGHKWNIFILDLSFIGWFLLGVIAFGIGVIFVIPYYLAVQAELFSSLRTLGVNDRFCTMEEFGYVKTSQSLPDSQESPIN